MVIITKNTKNNIELYDPNVEKLDNIFCCPLPSSFGIVSKIIKYRNENTDIMMVSSKEYPKYLLTVPPGLIL